MKNLLPVLFALATGVFWGTYGTALTQARLADDQRSPFKPYVMIGLAYLLWGVVGGLVGMSTRKDSFTFSSGQLFWGFAAGTLGAWGALTLTLAMTSGERPMPQIVMPIVFGTAVSVTAIVTVLTTKAQASPILWMGIVGMVVCIVIVASYTPHAGPHKPPGSGQQSAGHEPPASGQQPAPEPAK